MHKPSWHQKTVDFLKLHATTKGQLPGVYFEVVDGTIPKSYDLLVESKLIAPSAFIGVNSDLGALLQHPAVRDVPGHPRSPAFAYSLFHGEALATATMLSRATPKELDGMGLPGPVLTYNFDLQCNADTESDFWKQHWEQLHEVVANTYGQHGLCAVILNMSLHQRFLHREGLKVSEAVGLHANKVLEVFRKVPVKGLTLKALLGNNPSDLDGGKLDVHGRESGAFQVYRRSAVPMVTLRLCLREGEMRCGVSRLSPPAAPLRGYRMTPSLTF
jgi:hypothetical protein